MHAGDVLTSTVSVEDVCCACMYERMYEWMYEWIFVRCPIPLRSMILSVLKGDCQKLNGVQSDGMSFR